MPAHPLLHAMLGNSEVEACFSASAWLRQMLAFEQALACVQAEMSMAPPALADLLAALTPDAFDLPELVGQAVLAATPAIPFVQQLTARVAGQDVALAGFVHAGATSQDVMDTALMLCLREALAVLAAQALAVIRLLRDLAVAHRETLAVARTLGQAAGPTTFGARAAGWLHAVLDAHAEFCRLRKNLPLQCAGATGTLASFGAAGPALTAGLAARLQLRVERPWHTDRRVVRELAAVLAGAAAALGKIAGDLLAMMQTEVGEVAEAATSGRGGSSALPHKRNPVATIAVLAAARRAPGLLATVHGAFDHGFERAAGAWHAETDALVELCITTGAAFDGLQRALRGMTVDPSAMRRNLDGLRGLDLSEAASRALSPTLGQAAAQALVREACEAVRTGAPSLLEALAQDARVLAQLSLERLREVLAPGRHLGQAGALTDAAVARAEVVLGQTEDSIPLPPSAAS